MLLKLLTVCTLLALAGCGDDVVNNENGNSNENDGTIDPAPQSCLSLVSDEYQCLPEKVTGLSGQRVHIPLTGEVKEGMSFNWTTVEVEGISMPIFMPGDSGAYVVLPRTTTDVSLTLNVEGKLGSVFDSVSIPIDVKGAETLILNGINIITMNTDGLLDIEWLPAVNDQGIYANDIIYTLTLTKLVDGNPSSDVRTFQTSGLTESMDAEFGATYRFVLSVEDTSGNVTFSEHIDYTVADRQPELQEVITVTTKTLPAPSSLDLYSLVDANGVLKIVRVMENGVHYYDNAMAHEIFKTTAPQKVAMRLKELEPEEVTAYLQRRTKQSEYIDANSFTINLPDGYESIYLKSGTYNREKLCRKLEVNAQYLEQFEGSLCSTPSKTVMCTTDVTMSPELVATVECSLNSNFEVKLESKSKFELNQMYVYWPGSNMIKKLSGNKYFETIELALGTRIGAKLDIKYPLKVTTGFKSSASVTGDVYFGMDSLMPKFKINVSTNTQNIFKPLGEKWVNIESPSTKTPAEMGFELKLGVFPRISLEDFYIEAEAAAKLALKNKFLGINMVENTPGVNMMPLLTTVDGAIDGNGVGAASIDLNQFLPSWAPDFKTTVQLETPSLKIYEHPKTVTFNIEDQRSCYGKDRYTNDIPVLSVPEYGPLMKGNRYGKGWRHNETITIPPKDDLALASFNVYGPGAKLIDARHQGSSIGLTYNQITNEKKQEATLLYKFIKPGSLLQKAFPIYSVEKYTINRGENTGQYPWVCWGSAYRTQKNSDSRTLSLENAANISGD